MQKNVILAGVGGLGLVLTTKLICDAACKSGYDVKSNDVIGLSQRGGKVWGSVRFGDKIYSPNIPSKSGDIMLAMEPLEGYRWSYVLKDGGLIIMNTKKISPTPVLMEKEKYPGDIARKLSEKYKLIEINAVAEGNKLGNIKVANTFLVGIMARYLDIKRDIWIESIKENVPEKAIELNLKAFDIGYNWQ